MLRQTPDAHTPNYEHDKELAMEWQARLEIFMKNEEERYLCELRERFRHDFDNAIILAIKEGERLGERRAKVTAARSMLESAVSIDLISKFAGLSISEIESLPKI
jgi:hypothetical protein